MSWQSFESLSSNLDLITKFKLYEQQYSFFRDGYKILFVEM